MDKKTLKIIDGVLIKTEKVATIIIIDCRKGDSKISAVIGEYSGATITTFGDISRDVFNVFMLEILRHYQGGCDHETYNF